MKKIILITVCMMLLLTACSSKGESDTTKVPQTTAPSFDMYVGEGTLSTLRSLVRMHGELETNVFVKNHLPVDASGVFELDGAAYAPVNGGSVATYGELCYLVESTYTSEDAEFILNNSPIYAEIDGKFCFNMACEPLFSGDYAYDWSSFEIEPTSVSDEKIVFDVTVNDYMGKELTISMTAVSVDGNWRLDRVK